MIMRYTAKHMKRFSFARFFMLTATVFGLLPALPTHAAGIGMRVKGSGPAVYLAVDGKRYAFPNESVYKSWYADFTGVDDQTDADLAALPLAGNVTYRPGLTLVKITTDPRVYAVSQYGILHWITTEQIARDLYGASWNTHVVDIPDAFFINYIVGFQIDSASQYNPSLEMLVQNPEQNIRAADYVVPPAPAPTTPPTTNPAAVSITISTSNAVQNQTVSVYAAVQGSTTPINTIQIYSLSQTAPVETCLNVLNCSYSFTVTTAPMSATYYAVATDSLGMRFESPAGSRPTLTVSAASQDIAMTASPLTSSVGSRVSFSSIANVNEQVAGHKIYALIPGVTDPVLWKDCDSLPQCAASTPFYRTTNLYSQIAIGGQMYNSAPVTVTIMGGDAPKPTLTVTGHPMPSQVNIAVTAPFGETIGQTLIKDGTTLDAPTIALCTQSTCSITLQINVPGSVTAFTDVGGKYERSNSITVTP